MLRLVVDNTNIVTDQLFQDEIVVTRDEMDDLRNGFNEWMENQSGEDNNL